jgi:hypothetical protein
MCLSPPPLASAVTLTLVLYYVRLSGKVPKVAETLAMKPTPWPVDHVAVSAANRQRVLYDAGRCRAARRSTAHANPPGVGESADHIDHIDHAFRKRTQKQIVSGRANVIGLK